jgi:hypothetical protein
MHDALKPLIEAGWLDEAPTSALEVAGLATVVQRNLDEARGPLKYPDTRFWLAYQAVLAGATIVIRAHGARVRRERQHERTFAALRQLGIPGVCDRARYYDDCRRKRNVAEYDIAGRVSDTEAAELLREAERLAGAVRDWLRRERAELVTPDQ